MLDINQDVIRTIHCIGNVISDEMIELLNEVFLLGPPPFLTIAVLPLTTNLWMSLHL
jgi:hypothetical protein